MTAELLDWASSWEPPALVVQPPSFREALSTDVLDLVDNYGIEDDSFAPPLALRRRSTAAPLPLEGILKLQREETAVAAPSSSGQYSSSGQHTPNTNNSNHNNNNNNTAVRFMSPPPETSPTAVTSLFDGPAPSSSSSCFLNHAATTAHHYTNNNIRLLSQQGTSPARADDLSSQSQSITAPSSPSVNTTFRSQSFVNLTRKASEVVLSQLSRSSSLSSSSMKTRALAAAAAAVVRHIVEVGACGDPQCLMFYDPDVFTNPLSLPSRLRIASFRKHTGGSSTAASSHVAGSPQAAAPAATAAVLGHANGFGAFVAEETHPSDERLSQPQFLLELEHEDFEPAELDFDLIRVSRRLFSSITQQSAPLHDYLLDALNTMSSSSSPLLSTPETFVFALVLLERMQHASLLVRSSGPSCAHHHHALNDEDGALRGSLFVTAQSPTNAQVSLDSAAAVATASTAATVDDRVRSFLDDTTHVRLTKESLQSLSSGPSSRQCSTPSAAVGIVSDTESNVPTLGNHNNNTSNGQGGGRGGGNTYATMCVECIEQPGLALHASNIHLFFAAAVSVAIKMREDFANGPKVLEHIATLLHCPNVRTLCLAERCLCDMLKFDVTITTNEYRMMLRQLASHRLGGGAPSPTAGRDGQTTPVHGNATPVNGLDYTSDALMSPHASGGVSPGNSNNFMTLFATV